MIKKIVVPLDGSTLAEKALPYAKELAQKFEAQLILVRVLIIPPEIVVAGPRGMVFHRQAEEERAEATAYLNQLVNKLNIEQFPVRSILLEEHPAAESIVDLATQESADLIVMCTHGRSGVSRWIHGSVANKVLQHTPCPIFLVRSSESD
jgi:nucleotide-binding universal stress UspA family protein